MEQPAKIRVLHIIKSLGRGGAETLLPETLKFHDQQRYEFHYIYFLPWKNQMVEAIEQAGGKVTCLSASNNLRILLQRLRVLSYIRDHKINLIHCHLPWAGILGRRLFGLRIPIVYTEHNKQERYHWLTRWLNRLTFNRQTEVIAVSEDVASSIQANIHPRVPVTVIRNGVNTNSFRRDEAMGQVIRQQNNIPLEALVVGTVAVFRFQKRLDKWLEVFAKAKASIPNLYGVVVGDGPLSQELLDRRNALGLERSVIMPGLQVNVTSWLSAMDIYMMTSSFEGLPVALLEAMSAGCAVVATSAGGIPEVIHHLEHGMLAPVENYPMLASYIEKLGADETLRLQIAAAGRGHVESFFSLATMTVELEKLYARLA